MVQEKIGNMNGPWALMLKICLATYPVFLTSVVAWGIWMTSNQYQDIQFRGEGKRYTQEEAQRDREIWASQLRLEAERVNSLTNVQMARIESQLEQIRQALDAMSRKQGD